MSKRIVTVIAGLLMGSCATVRHEYTTVSPVRIYQDEHMTSRRLQDIPAGETVYVSSRTQIGSLYLIPVIYNGYRVYAYAPELQYKASKAAPIKRNDVRNMPSYDSNVKAGDARKRTYLSYPGGMVYLSEKNEPESAKMPVAIKE